MNYQRAKEQPMTQAQERYQAYLRTDHWQRVTAAVKRRAGYKCQVCNSPHDLNAHHRSYEHRGDELNHLDDVVCLCRRCHESFHRGRQEEAQPQAKRTPEELEYEAWKMRKEAKKAERDARREREAQLRREADRSLIPGRRVVGEIDMGAIEKLMPPGDGDIVLTRELIAQCRKNGAFTSATVEALGVEDMSKGWPARLEGKVLPRQRYRMALLGRQVYASKTKPSWRGMMSGEIPIPGVTDATPPKPASGLEAWFTSSTPSQRVQDRHRGNFVQDAMNAAAWSVKIPPRNDP